MAPEATLDQGAREVRTEKETCQWECAWFGILVPAEFRKQLVASDSSLGIIKHDRGMSAHARGSACSARGVQLLPWCRFRK